jgi:hypothetical protein
VCYFFHNPCTKFDFVGRSSVFSANFTGDVKYSSPVDLFINLTSVPKLRNLLGDKFIFVLVIAIIINVSLSHHHHQYTHRNITLLRITQLKVPFFTH